MKTSITEQTSPVAVATQPPATTTPCYALTLGAQPVTCSDYIRYLYELAARKLL